MRREWYSQRVSQGSLGTQLNELNELNVAQSNYVPERTQDREKSPSLTYQFSSTTQIQHQLFIHNNCALICN